MIRAMVTRLPNGNLLVPALAEGDEAIGDGVAEIEPDHPDYDAWLTQLDREQRALGTRRT